MERWKPAQDVTRQEQFILKRLETKRKLLGFLRRHRHELFDDDFQAELETMYRGTGAGSDPVPPAQLAMALLLQGRARAPGPRPRARAPPERNREQSR